MIQTSKLEKAFIHMINTHRGIIYKVCNLYFSGAEDRKDLFQEIVLQLWRSYPSFRNQSLSTTWMYRVALNTAISCFRKEGTKPLRNPLSLAEFSIPDMADQPTDNERLHLLKQAIQLLTKVEKAVIMLYLEEKSYEEMSEIMGISRSNIGVKINRIKIKLEIILKSTSHEL